VAFRGNTTIVVVEEQAAVQELIDLALRESSSCVLATSDRLEVVEVARRVRIDLLVIDVLVDRGGLSLVQDLRALQPSLRVLYLCGRDDADLRDLDGSMTLSSPFSLADFQEAVAVALDRRQRADDS
jgi:DNA-binding response OmpR family regulator